MDQINAFLQGQGVIIKQSHIDDSREELFDQVMELIDGGLTNLMGSDPKALVEASQVASKRFYESALNFRAQQVTDDDVLKEGAKVMGLIVAIYAQVLRDKVDEEDDEEDIQLI